MSIVGKCEKCGREFITMPRDGKDHFGYKQYGSPFIPVCGGTVKPTGTGDDLSIGHRPLA